MLAALREVWNFHRRLLTRPRFESEITVSRCLGMVAAIRLDRATAANSRRRWKGRAMLKRRARN